MHNRNPERGDEKAFVYYVRRGTIWHEGAAAIR